MTGHDPLCPWNTEDWRGNSRRCECDLGRVEGLRTAAALARGGESDG